MQDKNPRKQEHTGNGRNKRLIIVGVAAAALIAGALAVLAAGPFKAPRSALAIDGITCDNNEHTVYHTHTHLDIFVNGQPYGVPGGIGIRPSDCFYWVHTHASDGIIHVESPEQRLMTLGDFLDIWTQTAENIPTFPVNPDMQNSPPTVYVDGQVNPSLANYRETKIYPNTEIALVYGSAPSIIPSSYVFGKAEMGVSNERQAVIQQILSPSTSGSRAFGDKNAPITIVEFGDYQCNSCGIFHKESKNAVISNLVATGKANFLFKDFTLNDNILQPLQGSTLAAEAAYCAGDQGKFWQYHDELYNNQKPEGVEWVSEASLKNFAKNVGISDLQAFSKCLDSHQYQPTVDANNNLVRQLGLDATPTFIVISSSGDINPVKMVGAYPYQSFEAVVNQMLAASSSSGKQS